jgi:hypothetical protein
LIGDISTIQNVIRQNIGLPTDAGDINGNLNAKVNRFLEDMMTLSTGMEVGTADITITANTTWTDGKYEYRDVVINSGFTLSPQYRGFALRCRNLTVEGSISASGKGGAGGAIISAGEDALQSFGGAGGGGGADNLANATTRRGGKTALDLVGGLSYVGNNIPGKNGIIFDISNLPYMLHGAGGGGGGVAGSPGGGWLVIVADTITIGASGLISTAGVAGAASAAAAGGGGGGTLVVSYKTGTNVTALTAISNGGAGGVGGTYSGSKGGDGPKIVIGWGV